MSPAGIVQRLLELVTREWHYIVSVRRRGIAGCTGNG